MNDFIFSLQKAAQDFKSVPKDEIIRVVSHLDADGICAAALISKALRLEGRRFQLTIVQQLSVKIIKELAREKYKHYIFTDLGSSQVSCIEKILQKKVIILDHHDTDTKGNMVHINPRLFNLDGDEISGAGVTFLFAKFLNKKIEDFVHLAIIGAIGDGEEDNGFKKLNQQILDLAVKKKKIKVIQGLRFFGAQTKPLHKLLQFSTDPFIPGVSGSEQNAINFLKELGIKHRTEDGFKKIIHLGINEIKKIASAIVEKRKMNEKPEDILGPVYILPNEKEGPTRDAREFSTMLNACGRLNKASFGIAACLGDEKGKLRAIACLNDYKRELITAVRWYKTNQNKIIKGKGFMIINAEDHILPTIAGTLGSILSKSNEIEDNTLIMSMAQLMDSTTKISLRIAGLHPDKNKDLRKILRSIIERTGGETGGHLHAAGAIIQTEKEQEFIDVAKDILSKAGLEEQIN